MSYESYTYGHLGYDFIYFKRLPKKALKTRSKLSVARANENLVAPLSIVLTQLCMNYEH